MDNKKYKVVSIIGLIASLIPLLTIMDVLLKIEMTPSVQSVWAGVNIVSVIMGLILSIIGIKDKSSRSIINISSLVISMIWVLNILGILAIAILANFS